MIARERLPSTEAQGTELPHFPLSLKSGRCPSDIFVFFYLVYIFGFEGSAKMLDVQLCNYQRPRNLLQDKLTRMPRIG